MDEFLLRAFVVHVSTDADDWRSRGHLHETFWIIEEEMQAGGYWHRTVVNEDSYLYRVFFSEGFYHPWVHMALWLDCEREKLK